nr:unnamed protein product [Callosobruchus chinensis]
MILLVSVTVYKYFVYFSTGCHGDIYDVSSALIKEFATYIAKPISHIINACFEEGHFPSVYKTSKVLALHKKGDVNDPQSYRQIHIVPSISKITEYAILDQLVTYTGKNNILNENQYGFMQGKGTTDAVMNIVEGIQQAFEDRDTYVTVCTDLSKAFDCISHDKLLRKLEKYGCCVLYFLADGQRVYAQEGRMNLFHSFLQLGRAKNLLDKYQEYKQKTLQGDHGKTVQFYMMYVTFIDYHLTLSEIIRTGSFCVFTSVLPKIANLFFAFSQQNYSRYLVKYHDNLLKVDQSHLGLKEQLQLGTFGVKRTDKPYSRQPIDLTLEQTINADAANKLTGVSHTTNSISARQRWCKSHTLRSTIISHTMEQAGLRKRQDITADLQKSRINKNSQQLLNFTDNIKQNINPFAADLDKNRLFDILTGQTVQENIESFLHG